MRRVVLARPAPAAASALASASWVGIAAEQDRVHLEGRELGVFPYVEGQDLGQVLDSHPEGLSASSIETVRDQAVALLDAAPVAHGALSLATIRVDRHGRVWLVGFTGSGDSDRRDLEALLEEILVDPSSLDLASLVEGIGLTRLAPHPWSGRELKEVGASVGPPPKARAAAIAGLTLILGFLSGWFLASGG